MKLGNTIQKGNEGTGRNYNILYKGMRVKGDLQRTKFFETSENSKEFSAGNRSFASKGVSPLLAAILLIAISVVLASILLNWSSLFTSGQTEDIENTSNVIRNCPVITIDDVFLDFTSNRSRVFVSSKIEGTVDSIKLVARNGVDMPLNTKVPVEINKGDIKIFEFNLTSNLSSCTNFSRVILATICSTVTYAQSPANC